MNNYGPNNYTITYTTGGTEFSNSFESYTINLSDFDFTSGYSTTYVDSASLSGIGFYDRIDREFDLTYTSESDYTDAKAMLKSIGILKDV